MEFADDSGPQDEHLDVVYINEKLNRDDWHTFEVGKTRFNDEALREASEYHHQQASPRTL